MVLWEVLVVLFLILLNGFFAMSELAVISARRARLQAMADDGRRGATAALLLLENSGRFLSSVQIGITLVGIFAGAFSGATLAQPLAAQLPGLGEWAEEVAFALVVAAVTYASLIIGELVPKQIALRHAETIAVWVAPVMAWVARVASPVVHALDASTRFILRLLGQGARRESPVTEEELQMMITEATDAGLVEHEERTMIAGVLRLGDRPVQAIMTPRPDMVWLDLDGEMEENLRTLRESHHSRFPVAHGDLDELVGIVQAKDLLKTQLDGTAAINLRAVVRDAPIVPEGADVLQLIQVLKQSPMHMAVVVDEYGSVLGLVTATDLLEAIVGSELAEEEEEGDTAVVQREDGSWLIDGSLPVDRFKELVGVKELPDEEDYHTIAGFVLFVLARVPKPGEHLEWNGYRIEILDMDGHRIDKVLLERLPSEAP